MFSKAKKACYCEFNVNFIFVYLIMLFFDTENQKALDPSEILLICCSNSCAVIIIIIIIIILQDSLMNRNFKRTAFLKKNI